MREALRLACEGVDSRAGGPFGAVVVRGGEIVGRGWNRVTSTNDPTAHAEIVAIRDAARRLGTFRLDDCELFTSCEPCPMCLGAVYWARLKRLWYAATREDAAQAGFDDAWFYEQMALPIEQRALPMELLLHDEGRAPFQRWQALADRTPY
jgi:tRNA(Arg) A34 adenosine deaminase TadA